MHAARIHPMKLVPCKNGVKRTSGTSDLPQALIYLHLAFAGTLSTFLSEQSHAPAIPPTRRYMTPNWTAVSGRGRASQAIMTACSGALVATVVTGAVELGPCQIVYILVSIPTL